MYWDDICITWEAYRRRETKGFHGQSSIVQEKDEAAIFNLNTRNTSESQRVRALKANVPRDTGVTPSLTSRLASSAALWLCPALAQVLLRIVRPVFLTRRRTAAPRSWLSRLRLTPPLRYQNMAPALLAVSFLSTMPLSLRRSRFTAELTPSRPMVAGCSLTLGPHRPLSDATHCITCCRWG